jgi:hypothetical protein
MIHRLLCRIGLHVWGHEFDNEGWSYDVKYGPDCAICGATRKPPPYPERPDPLKLAFVPPMTEAEYELWNKRTAEFLMANLALADNYAGDLKVGPEFDGVACKWTEDRLNG